MSSLFAEGWGWFRKVLANSQEIYPKLFPVTLLPHNLEAISANLVIKLIHKVERECTH